MYKEGDEYASNGIETSVQKFFLEHFSANQEPQQLA